MKNFYNKTKETLNKWDILRGGDVIKPEINRGTFIYHEQKVCKVSGKLKKLFGFTKWASSLS